ncbi:hypothetical protein IWX81_001182 [Salinibacterium sp. CAN_S4]|uniref:J domain-containing protein n=1 Tax=Salinibacterium sp. CAN_S4 TaxID=2787727 RepID=UPI0018EF750E
MESPTHYELLCVTPDATADEIRAAYRRLVRMYHPDVAGAAGAAMTLRLNEAQRVLLDPALRSRVDGPASHSASPHHPAPTAERTSQFGRDVPRPSTPFRPASRATPVEHRSVVWDVLAIASISIIVLSTIAVFAVTYSVPFTGISARMLPPVIVAMLWIAAGLSRPPRIIWFLLGTSMLLWPLAASGIWPVTALVYSSPEWVWFALTASFFSAIALRVAAPRVSSYRTTRTATGRASTA